MNNHIQKNDFIFQIENENHTIEFNYEMFKNYTFNNNIDFFEKIFNKLPFAIFIYDCIKMKAIWANNEAEKRIGYSVEDLKNKTIEWYLDLFHPDDRNIIIESVRTFTENISNEYSGIYRIKSQLGEGWHWTYSKSSLFSESEDKSSKLILTTALNLSSNLNSIHKVDDIMKENSRMRNLILIESLTIRETQILQYIAKGKNTAQIAEIMYISRHTVNTHRKKISKKLDLHSMASLATFAVQNGI